MPSCYKLDEQTGDPDLMSSSLNTLAGIYIGANQPQEAEKYILKGIELSQKADNPARQAVLLGMASEVYHAMGNDNEALRYINQACQMEEQLGREDRLMVRITQKASVLLGMHSYQEAEEVLTQAIPYYLEAAGIFMKMGDMRNEMHARRGLYESYWTQCPDSAKIALERFNDLKDSLYSNATADSMALYNAEFGTDQLRQENESLARTRTLAMFALLFALLLAGVIWIFMRIRMEYGRQMLLHSPELSITEISGRCGFEDSTSFSRAFRRSFDVSPTQYREQQ